MAEYNMKDTLETMSEYMGSQLRGQLDLKEEEFRVDELPAPSASIEGEIYQYMGDSTVDYQHSYFYECVALGTSPETYGWLAVNVQPPRGSGSQTIQYHIYDEDEHIVGEWRETINGVKKKKPVYERTMTYDVSSTHSDNYTINYDTPISGFEKLVAVNGMVYRGSENGYIKINSYESSEYYFLLKGISGSSFTIKNQGYSGVLDITIRYTKTTDEWQTV